MNHIAIKLATYNLSESMSPFCHYIKLQAKHYDIATTLNSLQRYDYGISL